MLKNRKALGNYLASVSERQKNILRGRKGRKTEGGRDVRILKEESKNAWEKYQKALNTCYAATI